MSIENERKALIRNTLRRATYKWKYRNECLSKARVERGLYLCNICMNIVTSKEIQIDHIIPVIGVEGWTTYDDFVNRLLPDENGWQAICKDCHLIKTTQEKKDRAQYKKNNKKEENED